MSGELGNALIYLAALAMAVFAVVVVALILRAIFHKPGVNSRANWVTVDTRQSPKATDRELLTAGNGVGPEASPDHTKDANGKPYFKGSFCPKRSDLSGTEEFIHGHQAGLSTQMDADSRPQFWPEPEAAPMVYPQVEWTFPDDPTRTPINIPIIPDHLPEPVEAPINVTAWFRGK